MPSQRAETTTLFNVRKVSSYSFFFRGVIQPLQMNAMRPAFKYITNMSFRILTYSRSHDNAAHIEWASKNSVIRLQ
jgi:hypothetical protein